MEELRRRILGESVEERVWRKGEEARMERLSKAREAALEESKANGDGAKGCWWESD